MHIPYQSPHHPAIILINPQLGENIGAAARVMHNFGLHDLRIVAPRDGWPNGAALAMAAGAKELIEKAHIYATATEAVHDIQYLCAATARPRDMVKPVLTPRECGKELRLHNVNGEKCGLMFGPERSGLANEEVVLADAIVTIPINPIYPSLNLAQSVAILCYEWFIAADTTPATQLDLGKSVPATKEEITGFYEQLETSLDSAGFFHIPDKKPRMVNNIRNIFSRAELTDQDVRTLRGMLKSLTKPK